MTGMTVKKRVLGSVTVITLAGELDAHVSALVQADVTSIMPAYSQVLLDLSEAEHMTSAGLRTLLLMYRQGKARGNSVALVGLSAEAFNILSATGFLGFFSVADTVRDGIDLLARNDAGQEPISA
jgi:anti-sigma B factor antagonist